MSSNIFVNRKKNSFLPRKNGAVPILGQHQLYSEDSYLSACCCVQTKYIWQLPTCRRCEWGRQTCPCCPACEFSLCVWSFYNKKLITVIFYYIFLYSAIPGGRIIDNLQIDNRQIQTQNLQIDNRQIDYQQIVEVES